MWEFMTEYADIFYGLFLGTTEKLFEIIRVILAWMITGASVYSIGYFMLILAAYPSEKLFDKLCRRKYPWLFHEEEKDNGLEDLHQ